MGWQAPNLLDKIFEDPKVPDSNVIGNFMGGYLAAKDNAAKTDKTQDTAQDTEPNGGGGASGDTPPDKAPTSGNWVSNWMKSTMEGHQMAQNYIGYQEAVTATEMKKAETASLITSNQTKQAALANMTRDSFEISNWMNDHPTWESRQDVPWPTATSPVFQKQLTSLKLADTHSVQQNTAIADTHDFIKRVAAIDPAERARIQSLQPNSTGPSAAQWQLLTNAEQIQANNRKMDQLQAEMDAGNRGDTVITKVGPKGVEKTFKPATMTTPNAEPQTKVLADGTTLAWMPSGKSIHVIHPNGGKKELTPAQLTNLAKQLPLDDPDRDKLFAAAKSGALQPTPAPATTQPATVPTPAPSAPTTNTVARPKTKAEYDSISKGLPFIDPGDGKVYYKK